jgi:hypothetical protein
VVEDPGGTGSVAITRGPIVLAADRRLQAEGPTRAARFAHDSAGRIPLTPEPVQGGADVWMAFRAPCVAEDGSAAGSLTLCDYASAGNTWNRASEFRVWFPQPLRALDFGVVNLDGAEWIWHATDGGNPASAAPAGTRLFRRSFDLPDGFTPARAAAKLGIGADDTFTAWVNGHEVGRGDDWRHVQSFDVARLLRPGRNVLAVAVRNTNPSPAGLIARLEVVPAAGQPLVLLTDTDWRSAERARDGWQQPDFDDTADAAWQPARIVGPYGIQPWGDIG